MPSCYAARVMSQGQPLLRALQVIFLAALATSAALAGAARPTEAAGNIITVNSTADTADFSAGSGTCNINPGGVPVCTLRAAIQPANINANSPLGLDEIHFSLSGCPCTISP